jgi:hypothetical protein
MTLRAGRAVLKLKPTGLGQPNDFEVFDNIIKDAFSYSSF